MQSRAKTRLPGLRPTLLGAMPAVWVLLPGNPQRPHPAGALLVQVAQPPLALSAEEQQLMLAADRGLVPALRLLVYARECGTLLQRRDWVLAGEHAPRQHPSFGVPAWDSG